MGLIDAGQAHLGYRGRGRSHGRGRGIVAGRRGRGRAMTGTRGASRGGLAVHRTIDRRPRQLKVQGFLLDEKEDLSAHFAVSN